MKKHFALLLFFLPVMAFAQNKKVMTPELLWSLGRVSALSASPDNQTLLYQVTSTDITENSSSQRFYFVNLKEDKATETHIFDNKNFVQWDNNGLYAQKDEKLFLSKDQGQTWTIISGSLKDAANVKVSPDGQWLAFSKEIHAEDVKGSDIYKDLSKTTAQVYTDLNYRHWDHWNFGDISHVFIASINNPRTAVKDILENQPYDCPQQPFGGSEDFIFTPDSKGIIYVCKKKTGKEYAQSTNTDLYLYDIGEAKTSNLTEGMMGYDMQPKFSPDGKKLAWLSMKTDGFEADKNDLVVMDWSSRQKENVTAAWDETIDGSYLWSNDNKTVYFSASIKGTQQLFSVNSNAASGSNTVKQLTQGNFDVTNLIAQTGNAILSGRTDFNHANEIFRIQLKDGSMEAVTHVNDDIYNNIDMGKSELRMVTTKDGHQMGVWVVYPPNFDPSKKYPTLLYCQGGPQGALSQFYSLRWNFQLMAANGYIIVAPNRRGMPGWGVEWNACISKDWGGKPMQDYLDAIDALAKEPYVDNDKLGCVGASYGGYSVYMLAGIHQNRFKTFIAHDGLFDMKSWYGTTEELWFANWDLGGNYWQQPQPKSYTQFNPSDYVAQWNTPILIVQGGIDFRVPIEQGLEAFQAAQLRGIKSKLLYFPNENHWVLHPQNGILWQREFFAWLKETI